LGFNIGDLFTAQEFGVAKVPQILSGFFRRSDDVASQFLRVRCYGLRVGMKTSDDLTHPNLINKPAKAFPEKEVNNLFL